jgi:hypothetical protein
LVDVVEPDGLFDTVREPTGSKDLDHLLFADNQLLLGQEPSEAFAAGRRGQATLVGPEILDTADLVDRKAQVDLEAFELSSVVVVDHGTELLDEGRLLGTDCQPNTNDCGFMLLFGDVDHVDLSTAALAIDEMLRWRVDVPADIVDFLAVELEAREAGDVAFGVVRCPGGGELPVEEIAWEGGVLIAFKGRLVVYGQILLRNIDGRLVRSRLAQVIFCMEFSLSRMDKTAMQTYQA